MQSVAQSWLVYRLTHSSMLLGTTVFIGQLPVLVLGSLAGVTADRHRRWNIVVATQAASMVFALALSALTLTGTVKVWHVLALALAMGCVNAFDIPARQAFLVEMVGREDLMNAIALNSSIFNGARIVGPAIAGLLVGTVGEGWCFFVNGVSYVAVLAGLYLMRLPKHAPRILEGGVLEHIAQGFRYVRSHEAVWMPLLLLGVTSLTAMPYVVLMPIFSDQILKMGSRGLGILMSASGAGALMAAISLARRQSLRG